MNPSQSHNWLYSVDPDNWNVVRKQRVWGANKPWAKDNVRKDDRLIFYLIGSSPPCIVGIYQVASNWYDSSSPTWTDEKAQAKILWPYQVKVRPVVVGTADLSGLVADLSFLNKLKRIGTALRGAPANFYRPINEDDYNQILLSVEGPPAKYKLKVKPRKQSEEEKETVVPGEPSHSEIKELVRRTGELYGLESETEFVFDGYRLDVMWKEAVRDHPDWAFEIQFHGDVHRALSSLKHAWDRYRCETVLVTTPEQESKARSRLTGTFHEMEGHIRILDWRLLKRLHGLLKKLRDFENVANIHI